jgi:hypothetical protein
MTPTVAMPMRRMYAHHRKPTFAIAANAVEAGRDGVHE